MIIKSFTAESTSAALKKVRQEMGQDAIILQTRQLASAAPDRRIEITACLDRPTVARAATLISTPREKPHRREKTPVSRNTVKRERLSDIPSSPVPSAPSAEARPAHVAESNHTVAFQELYARLEKADFPETFLAEFMAQLVNEYDLQEDLWSLARRKLVAKLSAYLEPGLSFAPGNRVLILGPVGAGKSSVMGKLATRLVTVEKKKVRLASLDYYKMAAYEELASYADILNIEVTELSAPSSPSEAEAKTITLIDSPAPPTDPTKEEKFRERTEHVRADYRLAVFSALTRSDDIVAFARQLRPYQPTHLVMTMLDQTTAYGTMVAAAEALGCKIAFVTDTPGGVGSLKVPDPDALVRAVLRLEVCCE